MSAEVDKVFVVRFWREVAAAESPASQGWRARIHYVNDGRELHASSIEDAFSMMQSLLSADEPQ
jgi:hypothetical protein